MALYKKPWFISLTIFIALDFSKSIIREPINTFSFNVYAASLFCTFLLLFWLSEISSLLPKILNVVFVSVIALFFTSLAGVNYFLYREFGQYVTPQMLTFVLDDPMYVLNYLQTYVFNLNAIFFLLLFAFWYYVWKRKKEETVAKLSILKIAILILAPAFYLVGMNQMRWYSVEKQLSLDASLTLSIKEILRKDFSASLHSSVRDKVFPSKNSFVEPLTIILIINESFGKKPLPFYGYKENPMPFLKKWSEEEKENFFVFQNAFANSGSTQVSIPSLYTGVAPFEGGEKLHKTPLVWDWASAAGMKTMLVSSQRFGWLNLNQFLFTVQQPNIHITAENIDAPIVNDMGVDDLVSVQSFQNIFKRFSSDENIFAVYNSNALHIPFQQTSTKLQQQPNFPTRYENALFILDEALRQIYITLEQTHRLENSFVIITGDHGEGSNLEHRLPRLYSYYDEVMNVPFFIRTPKHWLDSKREFIQHLKENKTKNISNVDIIPTLAEVLNLHTEEHNQKILSDLKGNSLLGFIQDDRVIIGLNTNDLREWDHEGFGVYWLNKRFVYSDVEDEQYFDVSTDAGQRINLWKKISQIEKDIVMQTINGNRFIKRIYQKRNK